MDLSDYIKQKIKMFFEYIAKYDNADLKMSSWVYLIYYIYIDLNQSWNYSTEVREVIAMITNEEFKDIINIGIKYANIDKKYSIDEFGNIYDCMDGEKILKFLEDHNNTKKSHSKIQEAIKNKDWYF